jgi:hypothetical protein
MCNENADASKVGFFETPPERVVESCDNVRLVKPDDLGENCTGYSIIRVCGTFAIWYPIKD